MARDLPHVSRLLDEALKPLFTGPDQGAGVLDGGDRHGKPDAALQVGRRFDVTTAEGQFALGLWAGNQILAALHAPVVKRSGEGTVR